MADEIAESSGTANQVEWARLIKALVAAEFERVAAAFREVAGNQDGCRRARTEAVLVILEEKRATVLKNDQAGYFIREWQEIGDQVRQMIFRDERYRAIIRAYNQNTAE
jgi:aerobic-type carbon monoxide dehydrogenase small subunit (CoxS/CutS family)